MKTLKILVGGFDRKVVSLAEVSLLDICYEQAYVEFTRTQRLADFARQVGFAGYDLILVAPEFPVRDPNRKTEVPVLEEVARIVREMRSGDQTPVMALGFPPDAESALWEAGVSWVGRIGVTPGELKSQLRLLLSMPEPAVVHAPVSPVLTWLNRLFARPEAA